MKILKIIKVPILTFLLMLIWVHNCQAAAVTWDGGGTDETCGGIAGDGNKWSCGANWDTNSIPTASDVATFNGTSTKNATIDSAISITGIAINSGYTGTITQAATVTLTTSGFVQNTATYNSGDYNIDINDGAFALNGGTFTAPSGSLSIERNFTINSGATFNHNSGIIAFEGAGTGDDSTLSCGSKSLNSVEIHKTSYGADVSIGSNCTIPLGDSETTYGGTITNSGTVNVGTGTWILYANYTQSASGAQTNFSGTKIDVNYLVDLSTGPASLTLTSGSFTAASLTTIDVQKDLNNSAGLLPTGITLTLDGNQSQADSTVTCNGNEDFTKVYFSKANFDANITIGSNCDIPLGNDVISYAGVLTNNGAITVGTGTWNLNARFIQNNAGASLSYSGATIDVNDCDVGVSYYPGYFKLQNGSFTAANLTAIYDQGDFDNSGDLLPTEIALTFDGASYGDDSTVTCSNNENFSSITIAKTNSGGITTFSSSCTTSGDFSIGSAAGAVTGPSTTLTVGGDWINNGTYTHNSGTVSLNGTTQSLTGATTFYNLSKVVTATDSLTFPASVTQIIVGTLTLKGASNNLLSLQSSSPDTQWNINPQSTRDIEYLSVKDSNNINATEIATTGLNITNGGNNTGWNFDTAISMTFSIAGVGSDTLTNGITTNTASTYDTLPFESMTINSPKYMAHELTVTTNATYGYSVWMKLDSALQGNIPQNNIDPFTANGASWSNPQLWTSPTGTEPNENTAWAGVNISDTRVAGWTDDAGKFAPLETSDHLVMYSDSTDPDGHTSYVTYALESNYLQPADLYSAILIYNILPTY